MDIDEWRDFRGYCRILTDDQLEGVLEKEGEFRAVDECHRECYEIALSEAEGRGLR